MYLLVFMEKDRYNENFKTQFARNVLYFRVTYYTNVLMMVL